MEANIVVRIVLLIPSSYLKKLQVNNCFQQGSTEKDEEITLS